MEFTETKGMGRKEGMGGGRERRKERQDRKLPPQTKERKESRKTAGVGGACLLKGQTITLLSLVLHYR